MVAVLERPPLKARKGREYTADEVLELNDDHIWELVDGQLVEKHVANHAAQTASEMWLRLRTYGSEHGGVAIPPEGFVRLMQSARQLKRPDTGFIVHGRLSGDVLDDGYLDIPVDLIVEVISPRDIAELVEQKLRAYQASGVRLIWAIYPKARSIRVLSLNGGDRRIFEGDVLTGEDVLPGFSVPVSEVLPPFK